MGWDRVPKNWGAAAPTPMRGVKDLSAGQSKLGQQRLDWREQRAG